MPEGKGFSGKAGTAKAGTADSTAATIITEVTKWTLDPTVNVPSYNANTTFGHKRKVPGVRDSKGTIEVKVDGTNGTQFEPGAEVSLRLELDDSGSNYFDIGHAVIAGGPLEVDINDGEVVGITYAFEASDLTGAGIVASYGSSGIDPS